MPLRFVSSLFLIPHGYSLVEKGTADAASTSVEVKRRAPAAAPVEKRG
jgi:hypothetical protein